MLSDWQALVPCLTADITDGLPQVEIQDLATLTACCLEAAVASEAQAAANGDAAAAGAHATSCSNSKHCTTCMCALGQGSVFVGDVGPVRYVLRYNTWRCSVHEVYVRRCACVHRDAPNAEMFLV